MDAGYDSKDGGGRAAPGAAAESNAGAVAEGGFEGRQQNLVVKKYAFLKKNRLFILILLDKSHKTFYISQAYSIGSSLRR